MKKLNLYALDNNKENLLFALETEKYKSKEECFYCPACHGQMGIRKGPKNTHHFFHKTEICSFESYLHKVAKIILFNNLTNLKNSKTEKIVLEDSNSIVSTKSETIPNDFFGTLIENDFDRLAIVITEYLSSSDHKKISTFLAKIKATNDRDLIQEFIDFHNYLKQEINEKLSFDKYKELTHYKHNYSSHHGGMINDHQLIRQPYSDNEAQQIKINLNQNKKKWNAIETLNRLEKNIVFLNESINFTYREDHLEDVYIENIVLFEYFNKTLKNEILQKILALFYKPTYTTESESTKCDIEIDIDNINCLSLDSKKHNGFLADVLAEQLNKEPIFFEIAVTHNCSKEKIVSGINIIEINIKNTEDLEHLKDMDFKKLSVNHYIQS